MFGIGPAEIGVLILVLGGLGSGPLAGVPMPADPVMLQAAPQEALAYLATNGSAAPDPNSKNEIEQLLAEPELQAFFGEVTRLAEAAMKKLPEGDETAQALARSLPPFAKTLLTRPAMLYVAKVDLPPQMPSANAALVINAGDSIDEVTAAIKELEKLYLKNIPPNMSVERSEADGAELNRLPMPPSAPPVFWGVKKPYVFLTVGEGEAAALAKRLGGGGEVPEWLKSVTADLAIPRPAVTLYVNAEGILKTVSPLVDQFGEQLPVNPRKVIESLGVQHVRYLALGSGLNETVSVSKLVVGHDGEYQGLLKLLDGVPLTADDFKNIPGTAGFAAVGRLDGAAVFDAALKIIGEIEPRAVEETNEGLGEFKEETGLDLRDDILAAVGDRWTVYESADEGGLLLTGFCASVSVRDRARVEKVIETLQRLAERQQQEDRPEFAVRTSKVGEHEIHYIQFIREPVPFAPAWCLTDKELVLAVTPQMVRTHLTRPADVPTLAANEGVAAQLKSGDVTGLSYSNPKLWTQILYSYLNLGAASGASILQKETGIQADLSKIPSLGVILKHMRPTIGVVRRSKTTWAAETYASGPAVGAGSIAGVGVVAALVLPAVEKARETARQNTSRNNLRSLGLALTLQQQRDGKLPPRTITDADGKPLLSWRVAILPYIDQQALYEQFHLDEPWDSEHNRKLVTTMPAILAHPSHAYLQTEGRTIYQIPTGIDALYNDYGAPSQSDYNRVSKSKTAWITESAPWEAVEWTRPDDVVVDLNNPEGTLSRSGSDGPNVYFLDGSVRAIQLYGDEFRAAFAPRRENQ